jgi:hypothetical protein
LPETLPEIDPDVDAVPLVPPEVVLTLTPLAFVLVSVVSTPADVLTAVEQAPLQDALARVSEVWPATVAVLRA